MKNDFKDHIQGLSEVLEKHGAEDIPADFPTFETPIHRLVKFVRFRAAQTKYGLEPVGTFKEQERLVNRAFRTEKLKEWGLGALPPAIQEALLNGADEPNTTAPTQEPEQQEPERREGCGNCFICRLEKILDIDITQEQGEKVIELAREVYSDDEPDAEDPTTEPKLPKGFTIHALQVTREQLENLIKQNN